MRARLAGAFALLFAPMLSGVPPVPAACAAEDQLDSAFRRMYELDFDGARGEIAAYRRARPEDPLGAAAEAASYLFEEFDRKGVLTSEFFLDDERLLGGVAGALDSERNARFVSANRRARALAEARLKRAPSDAAALFALTLADGMEGDFEALIRKRQLTALRWIRRAEKTAINLLAVQPDAFDAYMAIGAANYIIGCLPIYKRMFLWFGGVRGDRRRGMDQLALTAEKGRYLRPLAKALLALAARREHQPDRARILLESLSREFPHNRVFARELALLRR